jgi:hypothetical protein
MSAGTGDNANELLDKRDALAATDDMAAAMHVEVTEELVQRATAWLFETEERIRRKRAPAQR